MKPFDPLQQPLRRVLPLPDPGSIFIGLEQSRVDMNGAKNLVHTKTVFHRGGKLTDQLPSALTNDGRTENFILTRHGQHLDQPMRLAFGDCPVEVREVVAGHLILNALLLRLDLIQAHPAHFRLGEGGVRNYRVVDAKSLQTREETVDRSIPGLMGGRVGKLKRADHITHRIDIGIAGL